MQQIGHRLSRLLAARAPRLPGFFDVRGGDSTRAVRSLWAALGVIAAVAPALWMWGFTVDDALIAVRYARHLAGGLGWRYDAQGPSTDGVTPLPWPLVLAPLARADPLIVLGRAKLLGLVAWAVAAAALGAAIGRARAAPRWARGAALAT